MNRSFFLALAGIALGTACTPEEQCKQIPLGSPSAGLAGFTAFGACYFETLSNSPNPETTGCFNGAAGPGPVRLNGIDAGPNAICQDAILSATDVVGTEGDECAVGYAQDQSGDSCIVWESGGKVVGHEWANWW